MKPLATALRLRGDSLYAANRGLHRVIGYQDSAQAQAQRQVAVQGVLYQDADTKAQVWKAKAKGRFWLLVGETALLLGGIVLAVGR